MEPFHFELKAQFHPCNRTITYKESCCQNKSWNVISWNDANSTSFTYVCMTTFLFIQCKTCDLTAFPGMVPNALNFGSNFQNSWVQHSAYLLLIARNLHLQTLPSTQFLAFTSLINIWYPHIFQNFIWSVLAVTSLIHNSNFQNSWVQHSAYLLLIARTLHLQTLPSTQFLAVTSLINIWYPHIFSKKQYTIQGNSIQMINKWTY